MCANTEEMTMTDLEGIIFNIQRYSVNDGPGIRTLVFFKGCPLQCAWCSNPESQIKKRQIMYFENLCSRCGACVTACPNECIVIEEDIRIHDPDRCTRCGQCVKVCTKSAVKIVGERMSVDEVVAIAEKDYLFYLNSGGGVTLGGGEPTLQATFAAQLLKALKKLGIHTAMETCGYTDLSVFERLNPHLDLILYDLKHFNGDTHRRHTGKSNARILQNLEKLLKGDIPLVIRIPVIPGVNDQAGAMQDMASFLSQRNGGMVERVDLLPYHKLGVGKYAALGLDYMLKEENTPDEKTLAEFKHIFSNRGFDTIVEYL
jgi:glycyl-radical enzyme activating protein